MTKLVLVSFFYEHLGWGYLGLSMVFAEAFTFSSNGGIDREERKHRKVLFLFKAQQIEKSESGPSFWRVQIWNDRSQKPKKNYGRHPMDLFLTFFGGLPVPPQVDKFIYRISRGIRDAGA